MQILKGKHEDEVSKLQQALISARENETRYVTSIERLEANHADAIHRLQVEHTAALDQCRQAEHTAAESKYMYDLQTQIEELKMLMKSVYDESSMSGPKLDGMAAV